MESKKVNNAIFVGCGLALIRMFVLFPLWYAFLLGLLIAVDPPRWVYVIFFLYTPVALILHIVGAAIEVLMEDS